MKSLAESGETWLKVAPLTRANLIGWVRRRALTDQDLALKTGQTAATVAASGEEIANAAKGFDEEVERSFRRQNPSLERAYALLDQIERRPQFQDRPDQVVAFLAAGGIAPREDAP